MEPEGEHVLLSRAEASVDVNASYIMCLLNLLTSRQLRFAFNVTAMFSSGPSWTFFGGILAANKPGDLGWRNI